MQKIKRLIIPFVILCLLILLIYIHESIETEKTVQTNAGVENFEGLENKSIGWGIKRADNHQQPDVGSVNKKIMDEYNGLYLGNSDKKNIYLTFDYGYEAGYTENILNVLKENNVKATFFITAHYVNTASDLVERMIKEGHIVGNQF